ncbi:MAG: OsmC family protein [Gammaproteobacteria bacterium]|nr:OsmC family protein [Gammaproteobacteria bacterium]
MSEIHRFTLVLEQVENFEFKVRFDWPDVPDLLLDEPSPLGGQAGPNAARLIAAGVANCLSASLLFCLQKSRSAPNRVSAAVTGRVRRNDKGRLRLAGIDVDLKLDGVPEERSRLERCLKLFEDYCVVTQAVRDGIPIGVRVLDEQGTVLHVEGQSSVQQDDENA